VVNMSRCKTPLQPFAQIPKKLHVIWVGDESKRPDHWIQTWRDKHPTWEFRLWGNTEYDGVPGTRWRMPSAEPPDIFLCPRDVEPVRP
jgi:hypothetical protein